MKYNRFEELPVWKDAIELAVRVFGLTTRSDFRIYSSLRNQIERAAVSVSNNVAEGFERGTTQELRTFLYISRGSCGETRSMLCLLERLCDRTTRRQEQRSIKTGTFNPPNLKSEISDLKSIAERISRQLRAWADSLQNSRIRGQRYLTNKTRSKAKEAREREEFLDELRRMREDSQSKPNGETGRPTKNLR